MDSRPIDQGTGVRRRRECRSCGRRFTTYERIAPVLVRKRDARLEPFDASKIRRGLENALIDRSSPSGVVDSLVERAEALVRTATVEVTTDEIGWILLEGLREVDEVAYLRFASVHKDFQGASDFEKEMAVLEEND